MYQMTLFFKKVIYNNNNCLISTHQKISNCTLFSIFLGIACPQAPLAKCMLFHYDLTLYICHIINSLEFMPPCTRFVTPQYKVEY